MTKEEMLSKLQEVVTAAEGDLAATLPAIEQFVLGEIVKLSKVLLSQ